MSTPSRRGSGTAPCDEREGEGSGGSGCRPAPFPHHLGEDQGQRPAMRGREREVEGADVGPLRVHTISERIRDSALR